MAKRILGSKRKRKKKLGSIRSKREFTPYDHIVDIGKAIGVGVIFVYDLWKEIERETGLSLAKKTISEKSYFMVQDKNSKMVKKGDLYTCLRYVVDQWRNL